MFAPFLQHCQRKRTASDKSASRGVVADLIAKPVLARVLFGFAGWSQIMTEFLARIVFEKRKTDRHG
jgi:hypothetical protein